jgi:hypothetical protein
VAWHAGNLQQCHTQLTAFIKATSAAPHKPYLFDCTDSWERADGGGVHARVCAQRACLLPSCVRDLET